MSTPVRTEKPLANVTVMSALGHKRTLASESGMSALPLKADMLSVSIDVRFVPLTDIGQIAVTRVSAYCLYGRESSARVEAKQ